MLLSFQPEICHNIKDTPKAQRRTIYFHRFYFPKARESELRKVLHGIRERHIRSDEGLQAHPQCQVSRPHHPIMDSSPRKYVWTGLFHIV